MCKQIEARRKIAIKVPYEKFQCKKDNFTATLTVVNEKEENHLCKTSNYNRMNDGKGRPAVIVCPGGAYFFKCDREGMPVAKAFAKAGAAAFLLDYSVTPNRFPAALLEVAQSILYVRQHAAQYNINPDKIIVCGFSAGGHLAATIGAMWHQPFLWKALQTTREMLRPQGIILGYPVITTGENTHIDSCINLLGYENCTDLLESDWAAGYWLNGEMTQTQNCWNEQEQWELKKRYDELLTDYEKKEGDLQESLNILKAVSIEGQITANTPPAFIWTTFDDDLVPMENSMLFVEAMRKENIPVEFHLFPHGIHGLSLATEDISAMPDRQDISLTVQAWFSMALGWMESL